MSNVRAMLTPDPPPILYHYTTPTGLLGIIGNRQMWASHTQYLNDQREFQHAVSIIEDELASMKKAPEHDVHRGMLDEMTSVLKDRESMNVCVCSFSEEGDVLSQWRAYGGGAGFSIGFSGTFLRALSDSHQFWLVKCIYDEKEQRSWMRTLLTDVLHENTQRELDGDDKEDKIPGGNLGAYLNRYAPILKHKSFAEEREWRIISRPLPITREGFDFRAGASMLIPFFKIPLFTDTLPFQVEEVVVGPTPHSGQSRRSLQSLLVKHGCKKTKVRNTAAPFRNW
jgi:hypothetical protein